MTVNLPDDLLSFIRAEVQSGHFGSEEELIAVAVRDYLRRTHSQDPHGGVTADQASDALSVDELQRRLLAAGVLSEIKPPIADLTAYPRRQAVPVHGEPLSETIIRERR